MCIMCWRCVERAEPGTELTASYLGIEDGLNREVRRNFLKTHFRYVKRKYFLKTHFR